MQKNTAPEKPNPAKKKKNRPAYVLLAVCLVILVSAAACKVFLDRSYAASKLASEMNTDGLLIEISDNMITVQNPGLSNRVEKAGLIFYSDLQVEGECYLPLMIKLARYGYDCFLPRALGNQPLLNIIGADSIFRKYGGIWHWYLVGHSKGCTPAALYAKDNPKLIEGLVYLGGFSSADLSAADLPLLSLYGSNDTVTTKEQRQMAQKNDPLNSDYQTIQGGNNTGFIGTDNPLPGDSQADITTEDQISITADFINSYVISSLVALR